MKRIFVLAVIVISSYLPQAYTQEVNPSITLQIVQQPIVVHGRKSFVYRVKQPDGTLGIEASKGQQLNIVVENKIDRPTSLHWHGIILPNSQDGVPFLTQPPIKPGQSFQYQYKLIQSGTFWLHTHFRLQEQKLLAAPFIIHDPNEQVSDQEVVLMLEDFSFTSPRLIYKKLRCQNKIAMASMSKMNMGSDINDVQYDAFLANERTLSDPQIVRVKPGTTVRLRIINAAASSNFYIDVGQLEHDVIAVDGNPIKPIKLNPFELGMAQRVDIVVKIPQGEGSYPILAKVEGTDDQTGIILTTEYSAIPSFFERDSKVMPAFSGLQEQQLAASTPLPSKPVTRSITFSLQGNMQKYVWKINNQVWPFETVPEIKANDRVEMVFQNQTSMSHPMHLHGHTFQVTEINGKKISGANRDTILVLPHASVKVQFDANNPGVWMMHCHNIYHAASGMITKILYQNYRAPFYTILQQGSMSGAFLFATPKECLGD